jgi:hypothetical protein
VVGNAVLGQLRRRERGRRTSTSIGLFFYVPTIFLSIQF